MPNSFATDTPTPTAIVALAGAVHIGVWELSDDERIVHRWFHCAERATPGGLRIKVHGMQYLDGSLDGLSIAISDDKGDVMVDSRDVGALAVHLRSAADELDQLATG